MDTIAPLYNTSQKDNPEVTAHHEAGHAVMARLLGRRVGKVSLVLNEKGRYNGYTNWDLYEIFREWDWNVPYEDLKLKKEDDRDGIAFIFAAGKASERIWYRQKSLDEKWASFGTGAGELNDEWQLKKAVKGILEADPRRQLLQEMQRVEETAVRLLVFPTCWQAVEAVAHELLERLKQDRERCTFDKAQARIAEVFAQAKTK